MNYPFESLKEHPRGVILDTDIGPDCDDVGALVTLIHYAKEYSFPILGICNCTSNKAGNGAIDAVCRQCGVPTPPIGQWSRSEFLNDPACHKYNDAIAERFSSAYADGTLTAEDETTFYRRLLSAAPDDGVLIVTIGMFNNLAALLKSPPDDISPLGGMELVKAKVHGVVSMACILPEGREYNILCDPRAAETVLTEWPTPIFLSDFHIGYPILTGYSTVTHPAAIESNPLTMAYHLFTQMWPEHLGDNCSYDLTAVQFAVLGEGELYGLGESGRLELYEALEGQRDATRFIPDPTGHCRFLVKRAADEVIAASLNDILRRYG